MSGNGSRISNKTKLYMPRIQMFINKYKNKVLHIHNRYIVLQGKEYTIELWYTGRIIANNKKIKFMFEENKLREMM
jgi:hypothetical protein